MAQDVQNAKQQLADQFFKAIDVIATKRMNSVKFDKTLTCQIIDDSNSAKGQYIVSYEGAEFFAYSENDTYKVDTWVYVTVPNGDFDQQKIIVGKYVADNTEYFTYQNPFDSYLDITGNLIDGNVDPEQEIGLIANTDETEIVIWETGTVSTQPYASDQMSSGELKTYLDNRITQIQQDYDSAQQFNADMYGIDTPEYQNAMLILNDKRQELLDDLMTVQDTVAILNDQVSDTTRRLSQFDRLGLQADFKTYLNKYKILSGHYGLKLNIVTKDPGSTSTVTTYSKTIFQLDSEEMFGNPYNFISWSTQQEVFDLSEFNGIVGIQLIFYQDKDFVSEDNSLPDSNNPDWDAYLALKNILVKNIYISLGYDLKEFNQDTILLYSFEPLTYSSYLTDQAREVLTYTHPELNLNSEEDTAKGLNIINEKNLHLRWIHVDEDGDLQAVERIEDLPTWEKWDEETNTAEILSLGKIHWYQWTLEDGVEDELAGAFWKEVNFNDLEARREAINNSQTNFDNWVEVPNEYNWFDWEGFHPDPMTQMEKFKVIIEYPSREYMQYLCKNEIDAALAEKENEIQETVLAEAFPNNSYDSNNVYHYAMLNSLVEIKTKEERGNLEVSYEGEAGIYTSPELTFENEHEVPNQASIDLVRALQLICDADYMNGVYRIYNDDGKIMNSSEASRQRILSAQFDTLITGDETLDAAEIIRWYFPVNQSMIEAPVEGCEYNLTDGKTVSAGLTDDNQWFCIERQGVQSSDRTPGAVIPTQLEQIFRIKDYYTQSAINNTIRCEVYKNNKTYSAECTLYFATAGNNGTDYTLTVTFEEVQNNKWVPLTTPAIDWHGSQIRVVPHIFDYENKDITSEYSGQFSYSFYSSPSGTQGLSLNNNIITRNNESSQAAYYHYILKVAANVKVKVTATNNQTDSNGDSYRNLTLTTYCPLGIRFDSTYVGMDGDGRITYDMSGVDPTYYKGNYTLYSLVNSIPTKVTGVTWSIVKWDSDIDAIQYYPQIDSESGLLIVPSMYMSGNDPRVSIVASIGGVPVWCQPLYISQDVYASAFLNSWDGSLSIDQQNGTIMSAMIGAGFKDDENRFNGVLMGQVGEKVFDERTSEANVGLFGYNEGEQSFGLKIDGTAFLGKQGHGRIEFDGNHGEIKSASFDDYGFGMKIDLDDAYIDFISENGANIHIGVNSQPSEDGVRPGDHDTAFLRIEDNNENPLLVIDPEGDADNNEIGPMFIQTSNFSTEDKTGVQFDLTEGLFTGYNFNIYAENIFENESGQLDSNGYIAIDSSAEEYPLIIGSPNIFNVQWDGSLFATKGSVGGWSISTLGLFSDEVPESVGASFAGVALHAPKPNEGADPLRISVGEVVLTPQFWVNYSMSYQPDPDLSNVSMGHETIVVRVITNDSSSWYEAVTDQETGEITYVPYSSNSSSESQSEEEGDEVEDDEQDYEYFYDDNWQKVDQATYHNATVVQHYLGYIDYAFSESSASAFTVSKSGVLKANNVYFPTANIGKLNATTVQVGTLNITKSTFKLGEKTCKLASQKIVYAVSFSKKKAKRKTLKYIYHT